MMEEQLLLVGRDVVNVIRVRYSTLTGGDSAIIFLDSCDSIQSKAGILVVISLPRIFSRTLSPGLCVCSLHYDFHFLCQLRPICAPKSICQFTSWLTLISDSQPNTNCAGGCCVVVCPVARSVNIVAARIPFQGFTSSRTMFSTLKVCKMFPMVWCTHSSITLANGLRVVIGLMVMIMVLNSTKNFLPLSTITLQGRGCLS